MKTTSNRIYYHKVQDHSLSISDFHNREFRSLVNRKNYLKFTKATLQGNDVRVYLCLHCTIIFAIIDFFCLKICFHIFFMYTCFQNFRVHIQNQVTTLLQNLSSVSG
jgi:hypothetical protein